MAMISALESAGLELVWQQFDMANKGGKPRLEYCADGDGFIVLRDTLEGLKLFDQARYICIVEGTLVDALGFVERYMKTNGYEAMFDQE